MRQARAQRLARLSQGLEVVDHAIGRYGVGDALDADLSDFLAADLVFDVGEGFVRNQDLPERRLVLQTRGQVHTAADHRIAHAVLATEIPDRAIASVDTHPACQRPLNASISPDSRELTDPFLHCDRHLHAGKGVLGHAPRLRITEEDHYGVAYVLGGELLFSQPELGYVRAGSPVAFEGSIRSKHRLAADLKEAEVLVRQRHIVLEVAKRLASIQIPVVRLPMRRLQALGGEFLPRLAHDRVARNGEYLEEAIGYESETQIFVHFVDPVARDLSYIAEALIGGLQLGLMSLDVGEIRVDDDNTVVPGLPLADLIPAPVAAL